MSRATPYSATHRVAPPCVPAEAAGDPPVEAGRTPSTEELLAQYADALTLHGPESQEVDRLLQANAGNGEFLRLAKTYLHVWKRINGRE